MPKELYANGGIWHEHRRGCSQAVPVVTLSPYSPFAGTPRGAGAASGLTRHPLKLLPPRSQTSIPWPFGPHPQDLPAASEGVLILLQ